MWRFKGHSLYAENELIKAGCQDGYFGIPYAGLYISGLTPKSEIYDLYLGAYDTAVPQQWFEKNLAEINERGGAVWSYPEKSIFGEPVFWDTVLRQFGNDVRQAILDGDIQSEVVE